MAGMKKKQAGRSDGEELTTAPLNTSDPSQWMRLPPTGGRLDGLSRTSWRELLDSGAVKGITIRKPHAKRGIRLIYKPSADAYRNSLLKEAA